MMLRFTIFKLWTIKDESLERNKRIKISYLWGEKKQKIKMCLTSQEAGKKKRVEYLKYSSF